MICIYNKGMQLYAGIYSHYMTCYKLFQVCWLKASKAKSTQGVFRGGPDVTAFPFKQPTQSSLYFQYSVKVHVNT